VPQGPSALEQRGPLRTETRRESLRRTVARLRSEVVRALMGARTSQGYWEGELASSALATATALVALEYGGRHGLVTVGDLDDRLCRAIAWLLDDQNDDGSWGDAPGCRGNIAATYLVAGALSPYRSSNSSVRAACERAFAYLQASGGLDALAARYGNDRTFVVPILTFLASRGLVDWAQVPRLPFELGILPHWLLRRFNVGVVSYALPALIAIGYAVARNRGSSWLRRSAWPVLVPMALRRLERIQPESGGYLEAVPLTAFVTISLLHAKRGHSPVVRRALGFLLQLQRADGSWPVDANLSCWLTSLSLQAVQLDPSVAEQVGETAVRSAVDWLLEQQCRVRHPYTDAAPGGWGWSHLSGSVPDVDDTSSALLALWPHANRSEVLRAGDAGVRWLLGVQNRDGGWPTFCKGWGWLPFDRSAPDLTAHAVRAIAAWLPRLPARLRRLAGRALARGLAYFRANQQSDGAFIPLWFGNEQHPREENPVYGTARVVVCYNELGGAGRLGAQDREAAKRAVSWLVRCRNRDGSWGGGPGLIGTTEETALALAALAPRSELSDDWFEPTVRWIEERMAAGTWDRPAPIGLYFAKLWYFERLYPIIFLATALAALGRRLRVEQEEPV